MLGPKTENAISGGDGNIQVGTNSGTINIGLTFEQHMAALQEAVLGKERDLERAHSAERGLLLREIDALKSNLVNAQQSYDDRVQELAATKALLARYDNQLDAQKLQSAYAAIDQGESALAQALLKELAAKASARREDASHEEAKLYTELGKLAETEVRWRDAAEHYAAAARLNPTLQTLRNASDFSRRAGDHDAASRFSTQLLEAARATGTQLEVATALTEHAINLRARGRYPEAEGLFRQSLEIDRATIGEANPTYANHVNNLAGVVGAQGRYPEAEKLYLQAMEIDRATIGEAHQDFATRLNNLAGVVRAQGRHPEAEELYLRALEIDRATIGEAHPYYAIHLNNLAGVVEAQGRYPEAEELCRQALEINRATIGEAHQTYATQLNNLAGVVEAQGRYPEAEGLYRHAMEIDLATLGEAHAGYAIDLNNLAGVVEAQGRHAEAEGLYRQALPILRSALGDRHPNTKNGAKNLITLLDAHNPTAPDLPSLRALRDGPPDPASPAPKP